LTHVTVAAGNGSELDAGLEVLGLIALKGKVVTADALHCNRRTVAAITGVGGDYCMALKANQDSLLSDARSCFGTAKIPASQISTTTSPASSKNTIPKKPKPSNEPQTRTEPSPPETEGSKRCSQSLGCAKPMVWSPRKANDRCLAAEKRHPVSRLKKNQSRPTEPDSINPPLTAPMTVVRIRPRFCMAPSIRTATSPCTAIALDAILNIAPPFPLSSKTIACCMIASALPTFAIAIALFGPMLT